MASDIKIYIIGLAILTMTSCFDYPDRRAILFPIDSSELNYIKGDCVSFKIDSHNYGAAIIVNYSKDIGGLWYGLCFTDYIGQLTPDIEDLKHSRVFGRKVESTFEEKGFFVGLDIEFVNDSVFMSNQDKFSTIGHIDLDNQHIKIGAEGATNEYDKMITFYQYGRERRMKPPDSYRDHGKKINNFRPDEYFALSNFIIK